MRASNGSDATALAKDARTAVAVSDGKSFELHVHGPCNKQHQHAVLAVQNGSSHRLGAKSDVARELERAFETINAFGEQDGGQIGSVQCRFELHNRLHPRARRKRRPARRLGC